MSFREYLQEKLAKIRKTIRWHLTGLSIGDVLILAGFAVSIITAMTGTLLGWTKIGKICLAIAFLAMFPGEIGLIIGLAIYQDYVEWKEKHNER